MTNCLECSDKSSKGYTSVSGEQPRCTRRARCLIAVCICCAGGSSATRDRIRSIVVIDVTSADVLVSPGYDDGTTEDAIRRQWIGYYTELHSDSH